MLHSDDLIIPLPDIDYIKCIIVSYRLICAGASQCNEDRLAQNPGLMFNSHEFQREIKAAASTKSFQSVIMMPW